ncbi:type I polyketide synthase [Amphritea japonica]|uniref:Polyketide synthase n=1 Tax=Amphritea japonica ATCC BAA-1530 TaxID=1278309 RepID=A0A7R6P945_9GAMM|nr:type I polyketide synthase [Amphritea japonica]BBB25118.1 polyketide synthase [Amphritea japonica ATCC BAA-1530]
MDRRVALVGYSFRLPQTTLNTFWQDLVNEKDLITEVEPSRWSFDNHLHPDQSHPGTSYTFKAGSLGDISGFDADFFGISPREAAVIDPQQRYLLEMSWEAIEHAGIKPSSLKRSNCGVYLGISSLDYGNRMSDDLSCINASTATGNTTSIASNRLSYSFDLTGPSISMDTACSSSMVAFHQACQSILSGEVSTALTGGISLHLHPFGFIIFSKATMLSPDGRCKVFDESANGYVRSEGGGIFLLKDYDQAVKDGDTIHAIVAASSVNTDGYKSGITIPSCHSQARLMEQTCVKAGISADDIDYLEAHGTGTPVGDPIETRAIGNALGKKRQTPLPIGSVKSNLGHLEPASGVASLIKALLIIKHRAVPATISMKTPNPNIKFDDWNIQVVDKLLPLKQDGIINIGVNSFGFGGANAHVILQSAPDRHSITTQPPTLEKILPIIISGRTENALKANAANLSRYLKDEKGTSFYDIAWNYNYRKERHSDTALLFAKSADEACTKLTDFINSTDQPAETQVLTGNGLEETKGAVFVYSGNGCQWETMGKALLESSETFRLAVTEVNELFSQHAEFSLLEEIKGHNGADRFEYTEIAQPALFAIQVGITEYLKHQGIRPVAVLGHSVGEVAAAWASGALTLADAVKVIYFRSLLQGLTKGTGAMTAAGLSQEQTETLLQEPCFNKISLAGVNSYKGVTLAGDSKQLTELEDRLQQESVFNIRLPLDYAFHSSAMNSIESELLTTLADLKPSSTNIPFISTVTGSVLQGNALDCNYWWQNIRKPVLFCQALDTVIEDGQNCFIEIGAHPVLRTYLNDQIRHNSITARVIPTLSRSLGSLDELQKCTASIIMAGASDLKQWFPISGNRLELPTYAFQHERHWHPTTVESHKLLQRPSVHPLLGAELPFQSQLWENQIDTVRFPWLADHKVGESVVFPGAGFVEIALKASTYFTSAEAIEIEELEILAPLILEQSHSKVIQTKTNPLTGDIFLSSRTHTQSEEWTPNCKARVSHQSTGITLKRQSPEIPTREHDFNHEFHLALTKKAGLQYGPAFSAVESGWNDGDQVLAQFSCPDCIHQDIDNFILHPGILDSGIQLVVHFLKSELEHTNGTAFIPVRVGRITTQLDAKSQPTLARLKLLRKSPHSLLIEMELFDDQGICIAVLEDIRFKSVRLHKSEHNRLAFLNYHLTPINSAISNTTSLNSQLQKLILTSGVQHISEASRFHDEVEPLLESFIVHTLLETVQQVQKSLGHINDCALEAFQLQHPDRIKLFKRVLELATDAQLISRQDSNYQINQDWQNPEIDSRLIWNTLVREYPDYFSLINLAGHTSLTLPDKILNITNRSSIEPEETYSRIFRDLSNQTCYSYIATSLNELLAQQEKSLLPGERLQVLEVASNRVHFGHGICNQIDFGICDYSFASHNPSAIENFNHLKERYPFTECLELENTDTATANTVNPSFQLVVISFDSYRVQDNLSLLKQISPLLAEGASLLIYGMKPIFWLDLCFGDNPDWWSAEQTSQASSDQWKATLEQLRFCNLTTLSDDLPDSGFYLISATQPDNLQDEPVTNKEARWLVVSSNSEKEQRLIDQWVNANIPLTVIQSANRSSLEQQLRILSDNGTPVTDVIDMHLFGSNADPLQNQTSRCACATELTMAIEQSASTADLWLLTEGVGSTLPSDQPIQWNEAQLVPSDSALWGFGRTLMNESLNHQVRLVDLPLGFCKPAITTLTDILCSEPVEHELFITPQGTLFAPRLRFEEEPGTTELQVNDETISLGFELPGQLRNLEWQAKPSELIADQEIEIEVMATGLNFRDIMYALGMLSDEAIENGFAGASLGLEFSGRVTKTGKLVSEFSEGDSVVGFGSACFSNRIIATKSSIAPMPEGLSFEGAATIPTTFLTVYYALHHLARLQPGERVLIHGAAGGVGIAAIQIAQWLGADIYATVGSDEKRAFIELLGVNPQQIYNSRALTFGEEILLNSDDGKGVDVVLNSLSGEAINQNLRVLKPFGRFLELGKRDFYENTHIGLRPFRNNISYFGIDADQLQQELPELSAKLFSELMELFRNGTLFPLPYTQFNAHQVVDAFRYMQQAKQIGKVIVTYDQGLNADQRTIKKAQTKSLQLCPDSTYLVTGGLGGFGLKTAQWLVRKGAQHLLLVSRRGAKSEEAQAFLKQCEIDNIFVRAEACDVSNREALSNIINLCGSELPPLKGVIHAATVINDNFIRNLDQEQIKHSLAAKLSGAQYLDELTRSLDLDIFVLFSSVTTLIGNPGQAAYVAANHWLEALSTTRYNLDLPATCVRWGAIDDVGFLARNEEIKNALQNRLGGTALNSEAGLSILEQMIVNNCQPLGVMELDWHSLSKFLPTSAHKKFREISLVAGENEQSDEDTLDLEAMMRDMTEAEFHTTILDILTSELSEILMIPAAKLDPNKSIYDMGMDSLMGVELMTALEARMGIQVPVMALTETPMLSQLTSKIISLVKQDDTEAKQSQDTLSIQHLAAQHGETAAADISEEIISAVNLKNGHQRIDNK